MGDIKLIVALLVLDVSHTQNWKLLEALKTLLIMEQAIDDPLISGDCFGNPPLAEQAVGEVHI